MFVDDADDLAVQDIKILETLTFFFYFFFIFYSVDILYRSLYIANRTIPYGPLYTNVPIRSVFFF